MQNVVETKNYLQNISNIIYINILFGLHYHFLRHVIQPILLYKYTTYNGYV